MVSAALLMSPSQALLKSFLIVLTSPASHVFCTRILKQLYSLLHSDVCVRSMCFSLMHV